MVGVRREVGVDAVGHHPAVEVRRDRHVGVNRFAEGPVTGSAEVGEDVRLDHDEVAGIHTANGVPDLDVGRPEAVVVVAGRLIEQVVT